MIEVERIHVCCMYTIFCTCVTYTYIYILLHDIFYFFLIQKFIKIYLFYVCLFFYILLHVRYVDYVYLFYCFMFDVFCLFIFILSNRRLHVFCFYFLYIVLHQKVVERWRCTYLYQLLLISRCFALILKCVYFVVHV